MESAAGAPTYGNAQVAAEPQGAAAQQGAPPNSSASRQS